MNFSPTGRPESQPQYQRIPLTSKRAAKREPVFPTPDWDRFDQSHRLTGFKPLSSVKNQLEYDE